MGQQQLLLLVVAAIVVVLAITVGIEMLAANATESNRESVVSELNNLATLAIQHYKRPIEQGGGGSSFNSWDVPVSLKSTSSGTYSVNVKNQEAIISGIGIETGNDGSNPLQMIAMITITDINISVIN